MSAVMETKGQFIHGLWKRNAKDSIFYSYDPTDNSPLWKGEQAGASTIAIAHEHAEKAQRLWRETSMATRKEIVQNFAKNVAAKREAFADLIAKESGKPLWEAKTEVASVIAKVELSIQAMEERTAFETKETPGAKAFVRYKPQGIVAVLGPFNFPAHLPNGHIVPAILAGNVVLFKPSELTPATAEFMMDCWQDTDLPPGVLQCLQGDSSTGKALLDTRLHGVFLTGSFATGVRIHQQFALRPEVILALELGGNNPVIIGQVNDLKASVYTTLLSAFLSAGQRCTCARRLMVPKGEFGDSFLDLLIESSARLKIDSPFATPEPFMGPVISWAAAQVHLKAQQRLIDKGARPLLPLRSLKENSGFLSPGILDLTSIHHVPDEEIFAPLLQIYRYDSFEEALRLANDTDYGLSAALFSEDEKEYHQFFNSIHAGIINWNKPTTGALSSLPFGGVGKSGNHRPSAYFAADYCAYPIASIEASVLSMPEEKLPGINL